jgi:iron complex transport system substrate-binding protein
MPARPVLLLLLVAVLSAGCGATAAGQLAPAAGAPDAVTVTHDLGEVTLDARPERIVTTVDETTELVVALGLRPVGAGSTRVDATGPEDQPFDGYYLTPDQLGEPAFVGLEPNLEAIAALDPDLIIHGGDDDLVDDLGAIAPTLVYDVQAPGAWQAAVTQLGAATGRAQEAADVVAGYEDAVADARERLAPVVAAAPRLAVIYPEYRGGAENFVFGREFALAGVVPELGFELVGPEQAEPFDAGLGTISPERYGDLPADTILALGTVDWRETGSGPLLDALDVPVLGVPLDEGRPSTGPISARYYLDAYTEALTAEYRVR